MNFRRVELVLIYTYIVMYLENNEIVKIVEIYIQV